MHPTQNKKIDQYQNKIQNLQSKKEKLGQVKSYGNLLGHKVSEGFINFKISMYTFAISVLKRLDSSNQSIEVKTQPSNKGNDPLKPPTQFVAAEPTTQSVAAEPTTQTAAASPTTQNSNNSYSLPGRAPLQFKEGNQKFPQNLNEENRVNQRLNQIKNTSDSREKYLDRFHNYVDELANNPLDLKIALKFGDADFRKKCENQIGEKLKKEYEGIKEPEAKKEFVLALASESPPKLGMLMKAVPGSKDEINGIVGDNKLEAFAKLNDEEKESFAYDLLKNDPQGLAILMKKLPPTEQKKLDQALIKKMLTDYHSYMNEDRDAFVLDLATTNPEGIRTLLKGLSWSVTGSNSFVAQETLAKHLNDAACAQQQRKDQENKVKRENYNCDRKSLFSFLSEFDITERSNAGSVALKLPLVMPSVYIIRTLSICS